MFLSLPRYTVCQEKGKNIGESHKNVSDLKSCEEEYIREYLNTLSLL